MLHDCFSYRLTLNNNGVEKNKCGSVILTVTTTHAAVISTI